MSEGTELVTHEAQGMARTVESVTLEIRTLQVQAQQIVLGYIIEIGRRLVEVKTLLPHGEWGAYLKSEVHYSQSTAENYIKIFEEYGASQQSLFGGVANSQALGNLSYTKALRLLALPVDEREEFAEDNDVAGMSTRELDAAIKARDAALKQAEEADAERKNAEQSQQKMAEEARLANQRFLQLQDELEALKNKPAEDLGEITKAGGADAEELEAARIEARDAAEQALRAEIVKADEARKNAEDKLEQAKADLKAEKAAKNTSAEQIRAAQAAADQARAETEKVRRELAASGNKEVAAFGIYFKATQDYFDKMLDSLQRLEEAGAEEQYNKLHMAIEKLLEVLAGRLPGAAGGRAR